MRLFFTLATIFWFAHLSCANLSIEGTYQGRNLYVQNPETPDGFGFCATRITVNDQILPANINRLAFIIDFSQLDLPIGTPVFIVIYHSDDCKPKILNPEVLLHSSTFTTEEISATEEGVISWSTKNEEGKIPFKIEQYRWNKWITVGEVEGLGTPDINSYSFQITPHSGTNKIRVVQIDHTGIKNKSPEIIFESNADEVFLASNKIDEEIRFVNKQKKASPTRYELFDAYGNIVKKGYGEIVACTSLKKGLYHLNYDNTTERIIKK
ncbi:hypothetical protein [Lishizhenia sp.]|uniref:hypothetical protein n=1 Tax=Lishizhenia sp. TaxID=2497594 RepID=UPI00299D64BF|nr:hypothetical protein [Lishizhenia sp.]MDX1444791.1 hypothetical protein [Lishizhenia sp.]